MEKKRERERETQPVCVLLTPILYLFHVYKIFTFSLLFSIKCAYAPCIKNYFVLCLIGSPLSDFIKRLKNFYVCVGCAAAAPLFVCSSYGRAAALYMFFFIYFYSVFTY